MGISPQQIQTKVDFDLREVIMFAKGPLDLKPTVMKVPFAIFKAVMTTIMKAEAEDEINIMLGLGQAAEKEASKL